MSISLTIFQLNIIQPTDGNHLQPLPDGFIFSHIVMNAVSAFSITLRKIGRRESPQQSEDHSVSNALQRLCRLNDSATWQCARRSLSASAPCTGGSECFVPIGEGNSKRVAGGSHDGRVLDALDQIGRSELAELGGADVDSAQGRVGVSPIRRPLALARACAAEAPSCNRVKRRRAGCD